MYLIFSFCATLFLVGQADEGEYEPTLNKIFISGPYSCMTERPGVTCPTESSSNGTKSCINSDDPLTHFYLFTPKNKDNPEFLHKCGGRLPNNTFFDPKLNTTIFVHGFGDGVCRTAVWREMKEQMFCRGDYNIIIIDWSRESLPDVYGALRASKFVAERLCCVIINMIEQIGALPALMHIVGHSFGAHIAGIAGQCVRNVTDTPLRRITGLDPANIGFCGYPPDQRLSQDDAQCVDVMHTNAGECNPIHIGCKDILGHADFYPNGGSFQCSCFPNILLGYLKQDILSATISLTISFCHHLQALQYYKVSINPCKCQFVGIECKNYTEFTCGRCKTCNGSNCAVMGMDWEDYYTCSNSTNSTGRAYYLDTSVCCPYCDNCKIELNEFNKTAHPEGPGLHCCNQGKKNDSSSSCGIPSIG